VPHWANPVIPVGTYSCAALAVELTDLLTNVDRPDDDADGADVMVGGDGSDTASYFRRLTPLRVTLDGAANDGAVGENDQAGVPQGPLGRPDVENVNGGMGNDVLIGTSGPNFLVSRIGADTIHGLGGADTIDVRDRDRDSAWNDVVDAGDGPDYCAANRTDDLTSCEEIFFGS